MGRAQAHHTKPQVTDEARTEARRGAQKKSKMGRARTSRYGALP